LAAIAAYGGPIKPGPCEDIHMCGGPQKHADRFVERHSGFLPGGATTDDSQPPSHANVGAVRQTIWRCPKSPSGHHRVPAAPEAQPGTRRTTESTEPTNSFYILTPTPSTRSVLRWSHDSNYSSYWPRGPMARRLTTIGIIGIKRLQVRSLPWSLR
jgi:hypothetical protein